MCVITTALVTDKWHVVAYAKGSTRCDIEEFDARELAEQKASRIASENLGCFYLPPTDDRKIFIMSPSSDDAYVSGVCKLPNRFDRNGIGIEITPLTPCPENSDLKREFKASSQTEAENIAAQLVQKYPFPFIPKFFDRPPFLQFRKHDYTPADVGLASPSAETGWNSAIGTFLINTTVRFTLTFGSMDPLSCQLPQELLLRALSFLVPDPEKSGFKALSSRDLAVWQGVSKTMRGGISKLSDKYERYVLSLVQKAMTASPGVDGPATKRCLQTLLSRDTAFPSQQEVQTKIKELEQIWRLQDANYVVTWYFDYQVGNKRQKAAYAFVLELLILTEASPDHFSEILSKAFLEGKMATTLPFIPANCPPKLLVPFLEHMATRGYIEPLEEIRKRLPAAYGLEGKIGNVAHIAALWNQPKVLDWILLNFPHLLNCLGTQSFSIAHLAAIQNNLEVLNWIQKNIPEALKVITGKCNIANLAARKKYWGLLNWILENSPELVLRNTYGGRITLVEQALTEFDLELLQWVKQHASALLGKDREARLPDNFLEEAKASHPELLKWVKQNCPHLIKKHSGCTIG